MSGLHACKALWPIIKPCMPPDGHHRLEVGSLPLKRFQGFKCRSRASQGIKKTAPGWKRQFLPIYSTIPSTYHEAIESPVLICPNLYPSEPLWWPLERLLWPRFFVVSIKSRQNPQKLKLDSRFHSPVVLWIICLTSLELN